MATQIISKVFCVCILAMLVGSPFIAVSTLLPDLGSNGVPSIESVNNETQMDDDLLDSLTSLESRTTDLFDYDKDVQIDDKPSRYDPNPFFDQFKSYHSEVQTFTTNYLQTTGSGYKLTYKIEGNHLFITATIGSYDIVSYIFDEGVYDALQIEGAEISADYGAPALPYKNLILSIPDGANVLHTELIDIDTTLLYGLDILPGPEPLAVSSYARSEPTLWFDPAHYSSSAFLPSEVLYSTEVGIAGQPALYLTLHPLQYNPTLDQGSLALKMVIDVAFDSPVGISEVLASPEYQFGYEVGGNYVIVVNSSFLSSVADFVDWKTSIGWDVSIRTVQDIYALYAGSDHAEELRNFIIDEYTTNGTLYYLLVGDCDVVPAREVWDPASGPGLDNGTEPSDLYFECLDGDWDANGNDLYGEMSDAVDLFPEVSVGRLPVQNPIEAEHALELIISLESNPEPGYSWLQNFMLIAPDCFGPGDGVNMVEEMLNQKYLTGSFFDVYRFYPTDGSLVSSNIEDLINFGVGMIDFFDHGAYDVWVDSLTVPQALGFTNGNRSPFAFGMACETAAFDVEAVEPTIGEAFFRAPNGGYHTYIAATRVAWAGYHCFDGFHNRFWTQFFADIFDDLVANPKAAMMNALYEMATVFDVSVGPTLETIYQAIYFGDPTIHMAWKQDVTTSTTAVGINEEVTVDGTCLQFQSGIPLTGHANITVKDPIGRIVYEGYEILDSFGEYSVSFFTNELSGNYTVETAVWEPFDFLAETEFYVGDSPITLVLDSTPVYYANLSFSGTSPFDGTGTARISTLDGVTLESTSVSASGGVFSGVINVTSFGWLRLHVMIDSGAEQSGLALLFKVVHGEILVISDSTGGGGPDYPGGWPGYNYGDSTNFGDLREALEDEYEVTEWQLLLDATPSLSYLHEFDAVLVSMGDTFGEPLTCADSFIIDILQQYHDEGGNLLFEGGSFIDILQNSYPAYISSLFHVSYTDNQQNNGGLFLDNSAHPITSGLPGTLSLADGLGSEYFNVFSPIGDSQYVSGYSGSYSGGTAISALSADVSHGAVVVIGFAIDAIQNEDYQYRLIQNAVGFLLHPTLMVTLSDYAFPFGTSETIVFDVYEASTGTPVQGAEITLSGCGVSAINTTQADGSCSIFVSPSSFGEIAVDVSKPGFLNYSTIITIYDKPVVSIATDPAFAEKGVTQTLTVIATEFYEGVPIVSCAINLTGCGVSVAGVTNSSGQLDLTIHPTVGGRMLLNATCSGYINTTIYVGVPVNVAILRSYGTMYPDDFAWSDLNSNWDLFGDVPVIIDYTSLAIDPFTLTDLENVGADVLVAPLTPQEFTADEVSAIISYVEAGHGFVATSTTLMYSPDVLAPFLGIQDSLVYYQDQVVSMDILDSMHPVTQGITDPYTPGYNYISFHPSISGWDGSVLNGADFLALDSSSSNYGAILTYRGMVYFSNVPPLLSNMEDMQIFYNALIWSDYVIPEHDLSARLDTLDRAEPGDTIYVDATVLNQGLQDETDVMLRLFIDEIEVDNLAIPTLTHGTSQTLTYIWTPLVEKIYNVTVFVDYVPDEYSYGNNRATKFVNVRPIQGYILWDESHDNYPLLLHSSYLADLEFEGYVVDTHTSGPITSAVLSGYDILVCAEFYIAYSSSELTDIQNFVMDGGGLLVMGDNDYSLRNSLTSYAGIEWIDGSFSGTAVDITSHPVTEGVSEVYFGAAMNILSTSGSAVSLVRNLGYDFIAASEYGFGYIVAICDDNCLPDGYYETADNSILAINIMDWMSVGRVDHDVAAILDVPTWVQPGEEAILYASIFNRGLNDEIDVSLYLYIDEVLVDSLYVPFIENGTSETLTYAWTPITEALYNVTAVVSEVPYENITRNNVATCFVNVFDLHNYYMIEGPATWYDAKANGVNLGIYGDDGYAVFDLNFTFQFYDSSFDRVYISTNGWLSFANTQPYDLSGPDFPSADPAFAYCIALYLADLVADQYDNYRWLGGEDLGTFQVVFHSEGLIEINYLEMYATPWGTGGLNHGNGIFGNAYPVTTLSGVTDLGVRYYYEPPTHEISLGLSVPTLVDVGDSPTISSTISNNGLNNETDVHYILYIDRIIVDEAIIPELLTGQVTSFDYLWSTPSEGIHNVTAYVIPVSDETMISNNRAEREVAVVEMTLLTDFESENHGFTPEGLWHLVDDTDPYGNSHSPTHSMWYGQDSTGNYDTGDSNWGTLMSRPILLGSDAMALNFWSWYETEDSGHSWDIKDVYLVLPDNSWYFLGYVSGTMNMWTEFTYDISDFRDTVVRIVFYFDTLDDVANDFRGWYVDDISIIGSVTLLDHDLQVVVEAPPEAAIGSSYEITATVTNWGTESEFTIDVRLYLNGVVVESAMISSLDSLESYTLTYWWTPDSMGIYNFTAYAVPEPSEVILENNVDTKLCNVGGLRQFSIIDPTDGSTIDGGLVYVAFEWNGTESPMIVSVYVNSEYMLQFYYQGSNDLFVPVFQNGTNAIKLVVQWSDAVVTETSVTIDSENVVPMMRPVAGDEANYRIDQPGFLFDYNFTFTMAESTFVWDIVIELAQLDPGTGSIISVTNASISVNILNGYIVDGGMTGWTEMHLFWVSGIDAPMPMQSFAGVGGHGIWFSWNEVYTIVDNSTWNGHPTWILDSTLTNYVLEVLAPNGLLVSLEDAAMGLHLYLLDSSFVPEVDTTPPEWIVEPSNRVAECGVSFEYQLQATDNLHYISWSVNDTVHFEIDDGGVVRNAVFLPVGIYPLEVTVADCYFNCINASFIVEVVDTRAPTWQVIPSDVTLEFGQSFSMQLQARDPSGIASWSINDTANFEVNPTGLVTNAIALAVGVYGLTVTVVDPYGNEASVAFKVTVQPVTTGIIPPDLIMMAAIVIIGLVGVIVIVALVRGVLSRRGGV